MPSIGHYSAYQELQSRMETITRDIARRQEDRDGLRKRADEEDVAISLLIRLHDEYQTIVGRSGCKVPNKAS